MLSDTCPHTHRLVHPREHGVAMLMVLIALVVATILSLSFLSSQATSLGVAQNVQGHAQARSVAESALVVGINYVQTDADWRTDKTDGQWVANASFNGGTFDLFGYDGLDTDGDGVIDDTDGDLADDSSDPVTLKVVATAGGVTHTVYAVVRVGSGSDLKVLMIADDATNLGTMAQDKYDLLTGWGMTVTLISDNDSQASFDAAMALVDVVYAAEPIIAGTVGSKVSNAGIGVVSDEDGLNDDLGLSNSGGSKYNGSQIDIIDNTHYITSTVSVGEMDDLAITTVSEQLTTVSGTLGSGVTVLATRNNGSSPTLVVVDAGGQLEDGSNAAGRRVALPWGSSSINIKNLNDAGKTILRRSLEWAGQSIAPQTPLARWMLDETTGTTADDAMGSNDGAFRNGVTLGQAGIDQFASEFDGSDDFVEVPHNNAFLLDNGSISLWFNPDYVSSHHALFSKDSSGYDTGGHVHMYVEGSRLKARIQSTGQSYTLQSPSTVTAGQWYHAAFTFGSGGAALYLDGQLVDTDSYTGGLGTTSGGAGNYEPIAIGAGTWDSNNLTVYSTTYLYEGLIDDARLYGYSLNGAEVSSIYNLITASANSTAPQLIALYEFNETAPPTPVLVGHWELDETGGGGVPTKVYWVNEDAKKIQSSDLDGSNVQDVTTGFEGKYVTLDTAGGKIYWYNKDSNKIQSSDIDGSNVQDITSGVDLESMVVDTAGGRIYWAEEDPDRIRSSDLDGSNVQSIASGFEAKYLSLDTAAGKLYWNNEDSGRITRANLDGSSKQDIVTGVDLESMVLDTTGGKIYWSEEDPDRIRSADMDGSNAQTIASGFEAKNLALDTVAGKLYWYNDDSEKITRANLDGSSTQDIAAGVDLEALVLDTTGGKIYWSEEDPDRIRSANMDGSGVQTIASGFEAKELLLNGGAVAAIDDVASNNGSLKGAAGGATGNGDGGTAVQFDGVDDYIEIAHDDSYLLDSGTVSFWFKSDNLSGYRTMFSKDSNGYDTGGHLRVYTEGSTLKARLQSTGSSYYVQSPGLSTGTWYHVVVSWGAGGLRLYRDGVESDTDSYTGGLGTSSGGAGNYEPIVFGADTWKSGNLTATPLYDYFDGTIDDARIYDLGFNESQAANVYGGNDPGTGAASTAYDTSGFGVALDLDIEDPGNVSWVPGGGLTINTATRIVSPSTATKLYSALTATNEMSIAVQFTPANTTQSGPARIVSYSGGSSTRNFTFGQEADEYTARLNTTTTTSNGTPSADSGPTLTAGVQQFVIVSYDGADITMYRSGGSTVTLARTGDLDWDNSFRFMFGDEITGGQEWLGTLTRVAIYDKAFNATQAGNVFGGSAPGDGTSSGTASVDWIEP